MTLYQMFDKAEMGSATKTVNKLSTTDSGGSGRELKVIYSNVRSMLRKRYEVGFLKEGLDPDIQSFSKTWLSQDISDNEVAFEGYSIFWTERYGSC